MPYTQKILSEGPFTAYDFFNVDNSMLTAAFVTIVTYLIILLQSDL